MPLADSDADIAAACARERIHLPGSIQPHGHLLAFEGPDLVLVHASAKAQEIMGVPLDQALGRPFSSIFHATSLERLSEGLRSLPEQGLAQLGALQDQASRSLLAVAHRSPDGLILLELETAPKDEAAGPPEATLEKLYPLISGAFDRLSAASTLDEITAVAVREVRRITGFDRALAYRFEENWDGVVVAEDRNDRLPSYTGLRFPATDIPAQARRLYAENRLRLIADMDYAPVPILPALHPRTGRPLDLSFASLRSVSPVHLEYMRNMGTPASMSISVLRGDRLWGLISCHHAEPRRIPFAARAACDLIGQMLAVRIAAKEGAAHAEERARLKTIEGRLLAHLAAAQGRLSEGLTTAPSELCSLAGASGAAVLTGEGCVLVGQTPGEAAVRRIAAWLHEHDNAEVFETESLGALLPEAAAFAARASGVLAISVSRLHPSFVLWFRPELPQTVNWGGDPRKAPEIETGRIGPRRSFSKWQEQVRGKSRPWTAAQIETARDLRASIVDVVLRQMEERAELTSRLERTNAELSAFSYSVSHDLRAPFRHIIGYAELLLDREGERLNDRSRHYLATIIDSAQNAGHLVDALLNFSRMGRASLTPVELDSRLLVEEVLRILAPDLDGRRIDWRIGPLPTVSADPVMLRQVFHNLIGNAVKYTRTRDPAVIEIGCEPRGEDHRFSIRDNGIGFDMAYAHKLFGVFQRLHRAEDYEGVGIGLANVRRIIERHGGRSWAEGKLDEGATFYFILPRSVTAAEELTNHGKRAEAHPAGRG